MTIQHTTSIERDAARLHEVLPWYVNGTLSEADREWVEQMLADDSGPAGSTCGDLDFDRQLAVAFEQKVAQVPADIGWAGLVQRVRADAAPQVMGRGMGREAQGREAQGHEARGHEARGQAVQGNEAPGAPRPARRDAAGGSWMQRLAQLAAPLMSPRIGMAMAALLAVQTIAIGVLVSERSGGGPDTVQYRSAADARPVAAIRALLDESITEKVLRDSLTANGASIVEGPNRLGEYWIMTGTRDPEAVAASLREAGVIASFVIDHRPMGR